MTKPLRIAGVDAKTLEDIARTEQRGREACERKVRFCDELAARAAGAHDMDTGKAKMQLYIYKCRWCHGWHLTRMPQPGRQFRADYYIKGNQ